MKYYKALKSDGMASKLLHDDPESENSVTKRMDLKFKFCDKFTRFVWNPFIVTVWRKIKQNEKWKLKFNTTVMNALSKAPVNRQKMNAAQKKLDNIVKNFNKASNSNGTNKKKSSLQPPSIPQAQKKTAAAQRSSPAVQKKNQAKSRALILPEEQTNNEGQLSMTNAGLFISDAHWFTSFDILASKHSINSISANQGLGVKQLNTSLHFP